MRRRLGRRLFGEWMAYYNIEPWDVRTEVPLARLTALLANCHRDVKKQKEPFEAEQFLVDWDGTGACARKTLPTQAELGERVKAFVGSLRKVREQQPAIGDQTRTGDDSPRLKRKPEPGTTAPG